MLVYLGVAIMLSIRKKHEIHNLHEDLHYPPVKRATYYKLLFICFIHGLAESAAMVILSMSTLYLVWEGHCIF